MAAVLLRVGWARLSLALVAREIGITPAALRQRFGGKHELLVAFYAWGTAQLRERVAAPQTLPADWSPLEVLYASIRGSVESIATAQQLVNALSAFSEVAGEPDLRGLAQERVHLAITSFELLLAHAVERGELLGIEPRHMAVQLHGGVIGACLVWAITAQGPLAVHVQSAVDALLAPYRPARENGA